MKDVVTHAPRNSTLLLCSRVGFLRLTVDTNIHDVVTAYSTVVHLYIPRPESDSTPLTHFKPRLFLLLGWLSRWRRVIYLHLRHRDESGKYFQFFIRIYVFFGKLVDYNVIKDIN